MFGFPERVATRWLYALIAAKLAFLLILAWNSRFVMDEFVQLGWAKYLGNGLFDTVWHAKAVGYVLFFKLAHLIGWGRDVHPAHRPHAGRAARLRHPGDHLRLRTRARE
jgi:hypothetical protein